MWPRCCLKDDALFDDVNEVDADDVGMEELPVNKVETLEHDVEDVF